MDTKPLSFGKLDIGYFMEISSALCPGSATLDRFGMKHRRGFFDPLKSKVNCAVPNGLYVWKPYYKHQSSSSLVNLSSPLLQEIRPKRTRQLLQFNIIDGFLWHFCLKKGKDRLSGADPGFQVRRGALKKIAPSGGRREHFWGISCEKSRFYAKKILFFQF